MHQIFVSELPLPGALLRVDGDERHYLGRALRARPGEVFRLASADGQASFAVLEAFEGEAALFRMGEPDAEISAAWPISLELCPPRGDALDLAVDMAVQLGVSRIGLCRSERTQVNFDAAALQPERLQRRILESCRQCLRAQLPGLAPLRELRMALLEDQPGVTRLLLSERGGQPLALALPPRGQGLRLMVGPEGGFSQAEHDLALQAGWTAVSLGPRPLKVPAAVAAALGVIQGVELSFKGA